MFTGCAYYIHKLYDNNSHVNDFSYFYNFICVIIIFYIFIFVFVILFSEHPEIIYMGLEPYV